MAESGISKETISKILVEVSTELKEEISDTVWTKRIKKKLGELSKDNNWGFAPSGEYKNEWLYDFTAYTYSDASHDQLEELHLIVESEWKMEGWEIQKDFEKLMVGRANSRLMIFQQKTKDEVYEIIKSCKKKIKAYRGSQKGDYYIFAGWNKEIAEFEVTDYIF